MSRVVIAAKSTVDRAAICTVVSAPNWSLVKAPIWSVLRPVDSAEVLRTAIWLVLRAAISAVVRAPSWVLRRAEMTAVFSALMSAVWIAARSAVASASTWAEPKAPIWFDVRAALRKIELRRDDGERGPQLVGGIGHEALVRRQRMIEPLHIIVDRIGQRLQLDRLVAGIERFQRAGAALLQLLSEAGQGLERPAQRDHQPKYHDDQDQQVFAYGQQKQVVAEGF